MTLSSDYAETAIVVFARVPAPGAVKTRLMPVLGAEGAAALQRELLARTLEAADRVSFAGHELCLTPVYAPALLPAPARANWTIALQSGADLGARMRNALERTLERFACALLVGADCPLIDPAYLETAAVALRAGADVVLGPSDDGGYVLVGLARPVPEIFEGVPWSTASVMDATRERIRVAERRVGRALTVVELPPVFDVDTPADLERMRALQRGQADAGIVSGES